MIRGIVFPLLKTIMRVRTNGSVILEMCHMERCQERTFLSNCGSVSIHDTLFLIIICWHARKHSFSHNPFAFSASEDRFSEFNCTYCYIASIEVNQRLLLSCQETDRNMIFANAQNYFLLIVSIAVRVQGWGTQWNIGTSFHIKGPGMNIFLAETERGCTFVISHSFLREAFVRRNEWLFLTSCFPSFRGS